MVTLEQNTGEMREHIRKVIDTIDSDDIKKIYSLLAKSAGRKAAELAAKDWVDNNITPEKIDEAIKKYRASK